MSGDWKLDEEQRSAIDRVVPRLLITFGDVLERVETTTVIAVDGDALLLRSIKLLGPEWCAESGVESLAVLYFCEHVLARIRAHGFPVHVLFFDANAANLWSTPVERGLRALLIAHLASLPASRRVTLRTYSFHSWGDPRCVAYLKAQRPSAALISDGSELPEGSDARYALARSMLQLCAHDACIVAILDAREADERQHMHTHIVKQIISENKAAEAQDLAMLAALLPASMLPAAGTDVLEHSASLEADMDRETFGTSATDVLVSAVARAVAADNAHGAERARVLILLQAITTSTGASTRAALMRRTGALLEQSPESVPPAARVGASRDFLVPLLEGAGEAILAASMGRDVSAFEELGEGDVDSPRLLLADLASSVLFVAAATAATALTPADAASEDALAKALGVNAASAAWALRTWERVREASGAEGPLVTPDLASALGGGGPDGVAAMAAAGTAAEEREAKAYQDRLMRQGVEGGAADPVRANTELFREAVLELMGGDFLLSTLDEMAPERGEGEEGEDDDEEVDEDADTVPPVSDDRMLSDLALRPTESADIKPQFMPRANKKAKEEPTFEEIRNPVIRAKKLRIWRAQQARREQRHKETQARRERARVRSLQQSYITVQRVIKPDYKVDGDPSSGSRRVVDVAYSTAKAEQRRQGLHVESELSDEKGEREYLTPEDRVTLVQAEAIVRRKSDFMERVKTCVGLVLRTDREEVMHAMLGYLARDAKFVWAANRSGSSTPDSPQAQKRELVRRLFFYAAQTIVDAACGRRVLRGKYMRPFTLDLRKEIRPLLGVLLTMGLRESAVLVYRDLRQADAIVYGRKEKSIAKYQKMEPHEMAIKVFRDDVDEDDRDVVPVPQAEYQLEKLGAYMEREIGHPDPRCGFVPDEWQRRLLNYVDARDSVVVAAPTSAGKTFVSYFCMQRVMEETDDGVVVYVSPTRALVRQVYHEIKARFRRADSRPFVCYFDDVATDLKQMARVGEGGAMETDAQIMVTMPEYFEDMLLHRASLRFMRRLRYVIFDEVHSLAQPDGAKWERLFHLVPCPFLALSATIGNPSEFQQWLEELEERKRLSLAATFPSGVPPFMQRSHKVHLVLHSHRYVDLRTEVAADALTRSEVPDQDPSELLSAPPVLAGVEDGGSDGDERAFGSDEEGGRPEDDAEDKPEEEEKEAVVEAVEKEEEEAEEDEDEGKKKKKDKKKKDKKDKKKKKKKDPFMEDEEAEDAGGEEEAEGLDDDDEFGGKKKKKDKKKKKKKKKDPLFEGEGEEDAAGEEEEEEEGLDDDEFGGKKKKKDKKKKKQKKKDPFMESEGEEEEQPQNEEEEVDMWGGEAPSSKSKGRDRRGKGKEKGKGGKGKESAGGVAHKGDTEAQRLQEEVRKQKESQSQREALLRRLQMDSEDEESEEEGEEGGEEGGEDGEDGALVKRQQVAQNPIFAGLRYVDEDLSKEMMGFHPLRALTFEQLMAAPDRQPQLPLSPEELCALYRVLVACTKEVEAPVWVTRSLQGPLRPAVALTGKRWLRREEVREYETNLKRFFFRIASRAPGDRALREIVRRTLQLLGRSDMGLAVLAEHAMAGGGEEGETARPSGSGADAYRKKCRQLPWHSIKRGILPLIRKLRDEERFPAIVFNLDRQKCEEMLELMVGVLEWQQESERERTNFYETQRLELKKKLEAWKKYNKQYENAKNPRKKQEIERKAQQDGVNVHTAPDQEAANEVDPQYTFKPKRTGIVLSDDLELIREDALRKMGPRDIHMRALERGIGIHHEALSYGYTTLVEHMFRTGMLGVVLSTTTLSMGIHAPCKTAVFAGDSLLLTPQLFRQMSGRAGRRGFDRAGQVICYGLSFDRISLLTTANVANMVGHQAMAPATLLRLLHRRATAGDVYDRRMLEGNLRTMIHAPLSGCSSRLTGPAAEQQAPVDVRMRQLAALVADATPVALRWMARNRLLDVTTLHPTRLALLPVMLPETGTAPFLLVHLIVSGALEPLCKGVTVRRVGDPDLQRAARSVMAVLARCFERVPLDASTQALVAEDPETYHYLQLPPTPRSVLRAALDFASDARGSLEQILRANAFNAVRRDAREEQERAEDEAANAAREARRKAREEEEAARRRHREEEDDGAMDIDAIGGTGEAAIAPAPEEGEEAAEVDDIGTAATDLIARDPDTLPVSGVRLYRKESREDGSAVARMVADARTTQVESSPFTSPAAVADAGADRAKESQDSDDIGEGADMDMGRYMAQLREDLRVDGGLPLPLLDVAEFVRPLNAFMVQYYEHGNFDRLCRESRIVGVDLYQNLQRFGEMLKMLVKASTFVLKSSSPVRVVIEEIKHQFDLVLARAAHVRK